MALLAGRMGVGRGALALLFSTGVVEALEALEALRAAPAAAALLLASSLAAADRLLAERLEFPEFDARVWDCAGGDLDWEGEGGVGEVEELGGGFFFFFFLFFFFFAGGVGGVGGGGDGSSTSSSSPSFGSSRIAEDDYGGRCDVFEGDLGETTTVLGGVDDVG